jgi:hypothetical protein
MRKLLALAAVAISIAGVAYCQDKADAPAFGTYIEIVDLIDLGSLDGALGLAYRFAGGGTARVGILGSLSDIATDTGGGTSDDSQYALGLGVKYLVPLARSRVRPYVGLGIGGGVSGSSSIDASGITETRTASSWNVSASLPAGFEIGIATFLSVGAETGLSCAYSRSARATSLSSDILSEEAVNVSFLGVRLFVAAWF